MEVDTGHGASAHRPAMLDGIKGCRHIFNMCGEIWWWVSRRAAPAIFGFFGHNLQVSGAERRHFLVGPFTYSVSGETPAGWSAGRFWGLCVASVKFSNLGRRQAARVEAAARQAGGGGGSGGGSGGGGSSEAAAEEEGRRSR
jgi:hypothetical protein